MPHDSSESLLDTIQKSGLTQGASRPLVPTPQFLRRRLQRLPQVLPPVLHPLGQRGHSHHAVIAAGQMSGRTGLTPSPGHAAQLGTNRVELHVAGRPQQIALVHGERRESSLPRMPAPTLPKIDPSRVAAVRLAQAATQAVLAVRHHDQMHVIGHQAIGPHLHAAAAAPFSQQLQIRTVILLLEEGLLSPIPTLRDMVGDPRNHNSRQARQARPPLPSLRPPGSWSEWLGLLCALNSLLGH